jgi:predicted transporter
VWAGALSGVGLAIVIAVIFVCLFYVAQQQVFKGNGRNIFEGFMMLIASYFITLLAFVMLKFKGYEQKWQAKLEKATAVVRSLPVKSPMQVKPVNVQHGQADHDRTG